MEIYLNEIQNLINKVNSDGRLSDDSKKIIVNIHKKIFGVEVCRSCNSKLNDAFQRLKKVTKEQLAQIETRKYNLKENVVIQYPFGSGNTYTNINITDSIATKMLNEFPKYEKFFESNPRYKEPQEANKESQKGISKAKN